MKKNNVLILSIAAFLGLAGFVLYKWWLEKRNINIWTVVPSTSVMAIETQDLVKNWNELIEKSVWKNLSTIEGFDNIRKNLNIIDSLSGQKGHLSDFLGQKQFVVSVHAVSNNNFGFVFYLPVQSAEDKNFIKRIASVFENNKIYRSTERNFQGFNIQVIKSKENPQSFSFIIHNNIFIGSYNPVLVEDVIRTIDESEDESFFSKNHSIFEITKNEVESARMYINYAQFHRFLALFTQNEASEVLKPIKNFANSSALDVNLSHQDILLNGFTLTSSPSDFLNCFKGQKAQPFYAKNLVPNRTSIFYHYGFDNASKLRESIKAFWKNNNMPQQKQWEELKANFKIDLNAYYDWIGKEIGMGVMESMNSQNPDRIILMHIKNKEEAEGALEKLSSQIAAALRDTVYSENYSGYKIEHINVPQFPALLLGKMFSGFDQSFYTIINNYLVLSNSIIGIKTVINDIEKEDTWGKSIKQNLFFEQCLNESNLSIFINAPRFWDILQSTASSKWQPFFQKYSNQFKLFENIAVQFSNVDNKFYSSVIIKHQKANKEEIKIERFDLVKRALLDAPAVTKPFIVKNHYDKSNEIFIQDSSNQVYLISRAGQVLWKKPLESPIVGDVVQIDYFKNGKLQLCFTTQNKLHILDRNGVEISKFPVEIPKNAITQHLSVIDYDNSKDYRFIISDTKGGIYMFDKSGANLEGWQPKQLSYRLASPVKHLRVKGRDYLIAVQANGTFHVLTRKGELYPSFPLELGGDIKKPLFIEQGPSTESTKFISITEAGLITQFNLKGEIVKQNQWMKPGKDSKFQLVSDVFARNWVIARQDKDKISILDDEGNTIFEQETPTNTSLSPQFYNFGAGNEVYALTDREQEFTYLYNKNGQLINSIPVESGFEIGLTFSEASEKYLVFKAFDKEASIISFK